MLKGQSFVLGDYNSSRKLQLSKIIQKLDGTLSYTLTKKTSFLVTTKAEFERDTLRISTAKKYNVFIVSDEFLFACDTNPEDSSLSPIDFALEPVPQVDSDVVRQAAQNVLSLWRLISSAVLRVSVADSDGEPPEAVDSPRSVTSAASGSAPQQAASESDPSEADADEEDDDDDVPRWRKVLERRKNAQEAARKAAAQQAANEQETRAAAKRSERAEAAALDAQEMRDRKDATAAQRAAFAKERKELRKETVKRNMQKMVDERRAQRQVVEGEKKAEAAAKHAAWLAAKMAKLEELARKLVERELHKAEFEAKQKQFQAEKEARLAKRKDENLRKLFVGGVNVDDLKHSCTALTGVLDKEKFDQLCTQRGDLLVNVFRQYGAIDTVKANWQERHAFILFVNPSDAQKALDELSKYENRKKFAEQTKAKVKAASLPNTALHKPNYYVRWNYNKGGGKKKVFAKIAAEKAKAEGKDEPEQEEPEDDGDPTAWEQTDSKGKSKPAPKPKKKKKPAAAAEKKPEDEWASVTSAGQSWADQVEDEASKKTEPIAPADKPSPKKKKEPKKPQVESIEPIAPAVPAVVAVPRLNLDANSYTATSTCVLMPPRDLWGPFVAIKKNHMNPRIKRPPYPHITLSAPFLREPLFAEAAAALTTAFSAIQPFDLNFDSFRIFANGASNTLYLEPQQRPANSLQNLYRTLNSVVRPAKKTDFEPHIGVGYFRSESETIALQNKYQKDWKPLQFRVKEIYFLHRVSADDPWEVSAVVPLGGKLDSPPHFELGETTAGDQ